MILENFLVKENPGGECKMIISKNRAIEFEMEHMPDDYDFHHDNYGTRRVAFDSSKHIFIPPCMIYPLSLLYVILRFIEYCPCLSMPDSKQGTRIFGHINDKKYQGLVQFYWGVETQDLLCQVSNNLLIAYTIMNATWQPNTTNNRQCVHIATAENGIITPKFNDATLKEFFDAATCLTQQIVKMEGGNHDSSSV